MKFKYVKGFSVIWCTGGVAYKYIRYRNRPSYLSIYWVSAKNDCSRCINSLKLIANKNCNGTFIEFK